MLQLSSLAFIIEVRLGLILNVKYMQDLYGTARFM